MDTSEQIKRAKVKIVQHLIDNDYDGVAIKVKLSDLQRLIKYRIIQELQMSGCVVGDNDSYILVTGNKRVIFQKNNLWEVQKNCKTISTNL